MFRFERSERSPVEETTKKSAFVGLLLSAIVALQLVFPSMAQARPRLVGVSLPSGSVVESQVLTIRFLFSEPLARFGVGLARAGTPLAIDRPRKGETPPEALIDFPPLPPGDYVLQWTAVGEDGGTSSGVQTFVVSSGPTSSAATTPPVPGPGPAPGPVPTVSFAPTTTTLPSTTTTTAPPTTTTTAPPTTTTAAPTPATNAVPTVPIVNLPIVPLNLPTTTKPRQQTSLKDSVPQSTSSTALPTTLPTALPTTTQLPVPTTTSGRTASTTQPSPAPAPAVSIVTTSTLPTTTPLSEPVPLTTSPGQAPTRQTSTSSPRKPPTTARTVTTTTSAAPRVTASSSTTKRPQDDKSTPGATLVIGQKPNELERGANTPAGNSETSETTSAPSSSSIPLTTDPRAQDALALPIRPLDQSDQRPVTVPVRTTPTTTTTTSTTIAAVVITQKPSTTQSRGAVLGSALKNRESGRTFAATIRLALTLAATAGLLAMFLITATRRSPRRLRSLIVGTGLVAAGIVAALTILGLIDAAGKVSRIDLAWMLIGATALAGAALLRFAIGNRTLTRRDVAMHTRSNANVDPGGRVRRAMGSYLRLASTQTAFALVAVVATAILMNH